MFAHVHIALLLQLAGYGIGRLFGASRTAGAWSGAFAGGAACVMREITQAEYRWIEAHGGLRRAMPDYQGMAFWEWNSHSLAETAMAILVVIVAAALVTMWDRRRAR